MLYDILEDTGVSNCLLHIDSVDPHAKRVVGRKVSNIFCFVLSAVALASPKNHGHCMLCRCISYFCGRDHDAIRAPKLQLNPHRAQERVYSAALLIYFALIIDARSSVNTP